MLRRAPPALSTRLRMELERLLERTLASGARLVGGLACTAAIDPQQNDPRRMQQLSWARRLGLPLMPALLLGAVDPVAFAQSTHSWEASAMAAAGCCPSRVVDGFTPSLGCQPVDLVDGPPTTGLVAGGGGLAMTLRPRQWKPLLRWWGRWRWIQAPQTARDLMMRVGGRVQRWVRSCAGSCQAGPQPMKRSLLVLVAAFVWNRLSCGAPQVVAAAAGRAWPAMP